MSSGTRYLLTKLIIELQIERVSLFIPKTEFFPERPKKKKNNLTIILYILGDFSVLCSIQAPSGERWMSGDFLAPDRVLVWSTEGKGYLYKLPAK